MRPLAAEHASEVVAVLCRSGRVQVSSHACCECYIAERDRFDNYELRYGKLKLEIEQVHRCRNVGLCRSLVVFDPNEPPIAPYERERRVVLRSDSSVGRYERRIARCVARELEIPVRIGRSAYLRMFR